LVPTVRFGKVITVGLRARAVPVPSIDPCNTGFTGSELVNVPVALLNPLAAGVNVRLNEQSANAGNTAPQFAEVTEKSVGFAPPSVVLAMISGESPMFVRMKD
jgi:hypothetical protein